MKLASFEVETSTGPVRRVGVLDGDAVVDVRNAYARALRDDDDEPSPSEVARLVAPANMCEFLSRGRRALEAARVARSYVSGTGHSVGPDGANLVYDIHGVRLLSPVPRPTSIRDYSTFEGHRAHFDDEIPDVWYELPLYTRRNHHSIVHPNEDVVRPEYTTEFDFELELAAVVGKRARDVPAGEAREYIAGYTIYNDFSARDVQQREREIGKQGRGKNPLNAFGPILVTPDEFDVDDATVAVRVNGETWSEGRAGEMQHSFDTIVEYLSASETLLPGEILCSGTVPGGSGTELGRSIRPGDALELEVEGIGVLANRIVEP